MDFGRAALVLAASSAFLACAQISGLSGFGFGSGGGGGDSSTSGGGAAGTGGAGGVGGPAQGGSSPSATGTSTSSAMSASTGPTSSAMSSTSTGGLGCTGDDPGVCCPLTDCAKACCHSNGAWNCQSNNCNNKEILCDSSADCPGAQICCGDYDGSDFNSGIRCLPVCMKPSTSGLPGNYEICSLSNPVCVTGGTCDVAVALPDDYGFCF